MTRVEVTQSYGGQTLTHVLVGDGSDEMRPGIVIFPTVVGVSALEIDFAQRLVALGYSVLVADLYGRRFDPATEREAAFAAMGALRADRVALSDRLLAVVELARTERSIDAERMAVIGYCFGGQCALDVARSGADIGGAVSFHGLFDPPGLPANPIRAKVLALHGWDDPLVTPDAVVALGRELSEAGADWQIHAYGGVGHAFTNPGATATGLEGIAYDEGAARRSWAALEDFLAELFG